MQISQESKRPFTSLLFQPPVARWHLCNTLQHGHTACAAPDRAADVCTTPHGNEARGTWMTAPSAGTEAGRLARGDCSCPCTGTILCWESPAKPPAPCKHPFCSDREGQHWFLPAMAAEQTHGKQVLFQVDQRSEAPGLRERDTGTPGLRWLGSTRPKETGWKKCVRPEGGAAGRFPGTSVISEHLYSAGEVQSEGLGDSHPPQLVLQLVSRGFGNEETLL